MPQTPQEQQTRLTRLASDLEWLAMNVSTFGVDVSTSADVAGAAVDLAAWVKFVAKRVQP